MTGAEILFSFGRRRIRLSAEGGGKLRVQAPTGALAPAELRDLAEQKGDLLAALAHLDTTLAEVLPLIDQLAERRPQLAGELRALVTRYHRDSDPLLFLAGDTVRRILANL